MHLFIQYLNLDIRQNALYQTIVKEIR